MEIALSLSTQRINGINCIKNRTSPSGTIATARRTYVFLAIIGTNDMKVRSLLAMLAALDIKGENVQNIHQGGCCPPRPPRQGVLLLRLERVRAWTTAPNKEEGLPFHHEVPHPHHTKRGPPPLPQGGVPLPYARRGVERGPPHSASRGRRGHLLSTLPYQNVGGSPPLPQNMLSNVCGALAMLRAIVSIPDVDDDPSCGNMSFHTGRDALDDAEQRELRVISRTAICKSFVSLPF